MSATSLDSTRSEAEYSAKKTWGKRIALATGLLLVLYGLVVTFQYLFSSHAQQKKAVTTIKILPDTPPPPPPPPKEPPKEQPKEQPKEMKVEPPKPQEVPPVPAEALKMEGDAGEGPSPFQSGTVTNDYKGGDVGTMIGGKKGLSAFAWYTSQVKARIEEALSEKKELSHVTYRLVVHVWIARDGRTERAELQGSSGDPVSDEYIRKALAEMRPITEAPPEDMPQPVKLRISSKNAG